MKKKGHNKLAKVLISMAIVIVGISAFVLYKAYTFDYYTACELPAIEKYHLSHTDSMDRGLIYMKTEKDSHSNYSAVSSNDNILHIPKLRLWLEKNNSNVSTDIQPHK